MPSAVPPYYPPGSLETATYAEFVSVARSVEMRPEPVGHRGPVIRDALVNLHGAAHLRRRRVMNSLVRSDVLAIQREEYLLPALRGQLASARARWDGVGDCRGDLVPFMQTTFFRAAGGMIGLVGIDTDEGLDELRRIFRPILLGIRSKFAGEDRAEIMATAIAAKREYIERFYAPSLRAAREGSDGSVSLLTLIAGRLDPEWEDEEVAVNDTLGFLAGILDSSSHVAMHSVDELLRWLERHPEDRGKCEDLTFLTAVCMEAMRLHPSNPGMGRVADQRVELPSGRVVEPGQWVACAHLRANTDGAVYGDDATLFNPNRHVASGVPRYGTSLGAGPHQCLGLKVVLGDSGAGALAHVLKSLLDAGTEQDPEREPQRSEHYRDAFTSFPVRFTKIR